MKHDGLHVLIALALVGVPMTATAHPLDLGYLRITSSQTTVAVTLDLDINAAAILLGRNEIDAAVVRAQASALAVASYAAAPIITQAGACSWGAATAELTGRTVQISSTATCSGDGPRTWTFPFVDNQRISAKFELMVKESAGTGERLTLVDASTTSLELASPAASTGVSVTTFIWSGVEHIGAAPNQWHTADGTWKLPEGLDHLLFLLGLMLGGGTLLQLLGIATGFTVGHSITLAIAALGIVRLPSSVIEPLVALSIALVAVEAFSGRFKRHRWKIALGFGLIHGFAFANALATLDLSLRNMITALFGFNIGVELGQVACVLVVAPLVMLLHRHRAGPLIVKAIAAVIFALGIYWFVERLI